MDTKTVTLTEFLLARIGERESVALDMRHQAGVGRAKVVLHGGGTGYQDLIDPARVLAECEAKRRIVERAARMIAEAEATAPHYPPEINDPALVMEEVLRDLALSYADHPDYRDEWRPQPTS